LAASKTESGAKLKVAKPSGTNNATRSMAISYVT
jgi:hypothetical protein